MWGGAAMRSESDSTLALDSVAWTGIQDAVRSFRRALGRGEHPAIEAYAPERVPHRTAVVVELIHEEMEFQIMAGEPALPSYRSCFPEIADDPRCQRAGRGRVGVAAARDAPSRGKARPVLRRTTPRRRRQSASAGTSWGPRSGKAPSGSSTGRGTPD